MSLRRIFFGFWLVAAVAEAQPRSKAECASSAEKAQTLREEKKLLDARKELLLCSQEECPKAVRSDCVVWLREVEVSTPSVVFRARGTDGADLVDLKVVSDGRLLASRLDGAALPIDPGAHVFRFEFPDGEGIETKALISEGEKNRTILVERKSRPERAPAPPATATGTASVATSSPPPSASVLPWVFVGVGALSAGAFGGLQLWARSDLSSLEDGCGKTRTCPASEVDPVRTKFLGSGVALGLSVVSFGVAGALWLWSPAKTQSVGAAPLPGGGAFAYAGAF